MLDMQPWYIDTPLAAPVISDPVKLAEVESRTPMKRVGQPEEVSGAVFDTADLVICQSTSAGATLRIHI